MQERDDNMMNERNDEQSELRQGQQNVYTVGSYKNDQQAEGTAPYSNSPRTGEYSYSRDSIPEYRYAYSQPTTSTPTEQYTAGGKAPKAKKVRRKRSSGGRGGLIALVIAAAVLMSALAGIGGAMLVNMIYDNNDDPSRLPAYSDGETTQPNGGDASAPDGQQGTLNGGSSEAIIIKNDDSVTVKTVGGNIGDDALTIPDVVALVRDSVVEIYTEIPTYNGRFVESGAGSGVIYSVTEDGKIAYIVTNNHVISGADTITVRLTNGNKYTAKLCGTDASSDIAVISIEVNESITVAQMGSSRGLVIGETVLAIGNPLGELGGTVTDGIISALAREVEIDGQSMTLLQTNAAVNPGNSGGGLFNMKGELIGVVNAKSSGSSVENIGFAIPVDTAYDIVKELMTYGYVTGRVDAGLTLIDVTDTYSAWYYGVNSLGVYVYESKYTDEIKSGDRVVSVNGTEVSTSADVKSALSECRVGDVVTVRISRNGKQSDVQLTLQEYVPTLTTQKK